MIRVNIKNLLLALTLSAFILLTACSAKRQEVKADANANANRAPERVEVATAPVVERNAARGIEVVGSFEAEDEVTVSSQGAGNLDEITVDIGTPVRAGQVIGRIDQREVKLKVDQADAALKQAESKLGIPAGSKLNPEHQTDVRQAKAALERARYDLNAAQNLVTNGDISRQQVDVYQKTFEQAEARYEAAIENVRNLVAQVGEKRAMLELAKKQLTDTTIISPIGGVV